MQAHRHQAEDPHPGEAPWLDLLCRQALAHPAATHRFLERFASAPSQALAAAYAVAYREYSHAFPRYLQAVIDKLEVPQHVASLRHNLAEERGHVDEEDLRVLADAGLAQHAIDVPHPELFARFHRAAVGDDPVPVAPAFARRWRDRFVQLLESSSAPAAVGALGLGTETVVAPIYAQLLSGLRRLRFSRADLLFFELHCHVDDQHQKDLLAIAADLGTEPTGRAEIGRGMHAALALRVEFWDALDAHTRILGEVREASE